MQEDLAKEYQLHANGIIIYTKMLEADNPSCYTKKQQLPTPTVHTE